MTTEAIVLLVVLVLLIGALPSWEYSSSWGYAPTGILTVLMAILLVWFLSSGRPLFSSTGQDVRVMAQDSVQDVKAMGREVAQAIRNTVQ